MQNIFYLVIGLFVINGCKTYKPNYAFSEQPVLNIDYGDLSNWAAHPAKMDESDFTPEGDTVSYDEVKSDVFFLHPTTYTGDKGQDQWNPKIDDKILNKKTDETTIRFQSSAFNHAGRIYAPRYRQAHLQAYFTEDKTSAKKAFELAYQDIKNAFEYYLEHENHQRPIIIASHSQGTNHAERLIKEFFYKPPLNTQLVVAYLLGMPIKNDEFANVVPCKNGNETGCFVSWRTFKHGYELPQELSMDNICVTNPLSWSCNTEYQPKADNKGSLLFDFNKIYPALVDAQIHDDILWANKPKFPGSIFLRTKNYHPADINFYYFNIRENVTNRVNKYLEKKGIR